MNAQDDRSQICRFASKLFDIADLYDQAAAKVGNPSTASWLGGRAECRRRMCASLMARAGLSGPSAGSILPVPEVLWLKASSLLSGSDEAMISPLRSADRELLDMVADYLGHSAPSPRAAAAAKWLHDRLEPEVGPTDEPLAPSRQPG